MRHGHNTSFSKHPCTVCCSCSFRFCGDFGLFVRPSSPRRMTFPSCILSHVSMLMVVNLCRKLDIAEPKEMNMNYDWTFSTEYSGTFSSREVRHNNWQALRSATSVTMDPPRCELKVKLATPRIRLNPCTVFQETLSANRY